MQRHIDTLVSLGIALFGGLLVTVPRFFLHPPVPVGLLVRHMRRFIFFHF